MWALAFALLGSAILGTLGLIAGIWADKFDQLAAFQNFIIMPLTFLSGVFYSIHSLPPFWQALSHFNPFFYMIDGFRYGFFGLSDVPPRPQPCAGRRRGARAGGHDARRCSPAAGSCGTEADSTMVTPESITIVDRSPTWPATRVEVAGDGQHFEALIVSPAFAGCRACARHQLVYAALGDRMREEIHALSMTTLTPEERAAAQRAG